ncbi:MAG: putative hydrolases or acyltransferases (alpha/beta hydrolase superfamily) [Rhodobacteraceae bacterium HLUCCA12]|nr:MAG: putative hydrolases or acyltransferases (alpha/beta hydrolase superfamily) [Rhodobacteraceae bacterium HLUCCA12]
MGDPGGVPSVLAHCFLGHSGGWKRLLAAMRTPLDARAFDLPGHGRSDPWSGQGDLHAQATAALAAQIDGSALLIGHSFGGTLALRQALEQPETVLGMVLIEPVLFAAAAGTPEFAAHAAHEKPLRDAFARGDLDEAARVFFALNGDEAGWTAMPEAARKVMVAQMPMLDATNDTLMNDAAGLLVPGRPEAFAKPVLVLAGATSPPVFPAAARAIAARLGNAEFASIPDAGHMAPLTHPAATAALIDGWLRRTGLNERPRVA